MTDLAKNLIPIDVKLSDIFVDAEFNCRGMISAFDVRELIEDIEKHGLQTPVSVMEISDNPLHKYRLLAGFRRFSAFQGLRRETIPAIVRRNMSENDAIVFNLTENLKRQDLNPVQEANAIKKLYDRGWSANQVSKVVGVSYGWVQTRFHLLDMADEIQQDVATGLLRIEDIKKIHKKAQSIEQQFEWAKAIKDQRLLNKKKEADVKKKESVAKARTRAEINNFQQEVMTALGPSFAAQALAWAQGEIDDLEVNLALQSEAVRQGTYYNLPPHLKVLVESSK